VAIYKTGSKGTGVTELQKSLNNSGYGLATDGIYGPKTAAAYQSKRIRIHRNRFIDCAWCAPYMATTVKWQGLISLDNCDDVDIQFNKFTKGGILDKTCLKLLSVGTSLTKCKFLNNDTSTLSAREIEAEAGFSYANIASDVAEFLALGCISDFTFPVFNQATEPTSTQIPAGKSGIWTDTDDAKCYLCYNHGGTVKTVELT
jgi:hypothetical protein